LDFIAPGSTVFGGDYINIGFVTLSNFNNKTTLRYIFLYLSVVEVAGVQKDRSYLCLGSSLPCLVAHGTVVIVFCPTTQQAHSAREGPQ